MSEDNKAKEDLKRVEKQGLILSATLGALLSLSLTFTAMAVKNTKEETTIKITDTWKKHISLTSIAAAGIPRDQYYVSGITQKPLQKNNCRGEFRLVGPPYPDIEKGKSYKANVFRYSENDNDVCRILILEPMK